jgi:hypothetical protein
VLAVRAAHLADILVAGRRLWCGDVLPTHTHTQVSRTGRATMYSACTVTVELGGGGGGAGGGHPGPAVVTRRRRRSRERGGRGRRWGRGEEERHSTGYPVSRQDL